MNYKKLLSDCTPRSSDPANAIVALLAGLAVGAVLGVLFAPGSGEETRSLISGKANDLTDNLKDKFQSVKDQVKTKAEDVSREVKGYKEESVKAVKNKIKDASNDANDAVQNI